MEELRTKLIGIINDSDLPFEAKYYIVKDVFRDISMTYNDMLKRSHDHKEESDGVQQCS